MPPCPTPSRKPPGTMPARVRVFSWVRHHQCFLTLERRLVLTQFPGPRPHPTCPSGHLTVPTPQSSDGFTRRPIEDADLTETLAGLEMSHEDGGWISLQLRGVSQTKACYTAAVLQAPTSMEYRVIPTDRSPTATCLIRLWVMCGNRRVHFGRIKRPTIQRRTIFPV